MRKTEAEKKSIWFLPYTQDWENCRNAYTIRLYRRELIYFHMPITCACACSQYCGPSVIVTSFMSDARRLYFYVTLFKAFTPTLSEPSTILLDSAKLTQPSIFSQNVPDFLFLFFLSIYFIFLRPVMRFCISMHRFAGESKEYVLIRSLFKFCFWKKNSIQSFRITNAYYYLFTYMYVKWLFDVHREHN